MIFADIINASATWTDVLVLSIVAFDLLVLGVIYLIRSIQETFAFTRNVAVVDSMADDEYIALR